ncbi:M20 family metallopeptidase [Bradyrhizobium sp. LHD-71]|uniref:M20 family metallopeptidase n=1 Tax=Bradyrhizobium sp. LHD-71 TaxID=3072141 RepID=UPI00280E5E8D|nr:M20 family metallopeptidase [Bradyrhizobium sp. LHD-71]MDQ8726280.1 M20 family metallopeptidase [Bradyrhizobium sp. LHD-71]
MRNTEEIWSFVDTKKTAFEKLADDVWAVPETCFGEFKSVALHKQALEREGFRVTQNCGGLPTAVMGEAGEGGPVIAILGEFDALPGLSQEAGVAERREIESGGAGHGCGHNLLGAGAMLAATAIKDYLAKNGLKGRVRYYGCPAEEGGSGKAFMVREGAFDDVDIAISWHPAPFMALNVANSLSMIQADFTFVGRSSHAAAAPHLGRSALDAVELMNIGVNYMREHVPSDARIHYAIMDSGGIAPNVVQARAKVRHMMRAIELPTMWNIFERVKKVAEGAALMTETTVTSEVVSAMSNLLGNSPLEKAMQANLQHLGPVSFDDKDRAFAKQMRATFQDEDIATAHRRFGVQPSDAVLGEQVVPADSPRAQLRGSTDVGDVSWVVPTVQAYGSTYAIGTPPHSWQMAAQGKAAAAHKGMAHAAKAMAATALDCLRDPALLSEAKADFIQRTKTFAYKSPLPGETKPPVLHQAAE